MILKCSWLLASFVDDDGGSCCILLWFRTQEWKQESTCFSSILSNFFLTNLLFTQTSSSSSSSSRTKFDDVSKKQALNAIADKNLTESPYGSSNCLSRLQPEFKPNIKPGKDVSRTLFMSFSGRWKEFPKSVLSEETRYLRSNAGSITTARESYSFREVDLCIA